ncbi:type VI secretion protein IcmF/TssM N-terminal domain-containing protein [Pseudomonas syringae]|uniref:type VI secretion protein IcmF/TssM N-terminal domain-containing protein n=1 Tax=Pseudomonas syringae TaxID=317 RepID=UPI000B245497|nr:type VI secretion protein IcmF/TssM N-terminal domain-containing protein [Pseudomonas syringae]
MLKKIGIFLLGVLALVILAVGLWALALYEDWPLWYVPVIFVGVIVFVVIARWIGRRWHAWRLRARMKSELPQSRREEAPNLDQDWKAGVQLLRGSRLGRMGAPLYALPWFLMLGESGSGKSSLLQHSGLTSALNPHNRDGQPAPTGTLDWWFLERGVVLDPAGRLAQGSSDAGPEWRRLLYWLLRSRRREPLNGLLLVIDSTRLLSGSDESLAEQGQDLRRRLDDLVKVFGARLPVYFIITGAEAVPGLTQWGAALTPAQREQPFGLLSKQRDSAAASFLDEMFGGIGRRLFDLRIELGVRGLPDADAFSLPERIGALRPRLEKLLLPAFAANPYSEPPLLCGLFLTAQGQGSAAQHEGWFSHDLFDQLLPSQRYAYRPIDSWRRWRRLLVHAAVIAWLALCVGFGALMIYADRHTEAVLAQALNDPPAENDFAGGLETDLDALRRFRLALLNLSREQQQGWQSLLPFSSNIDELIQRYRADYVGLFSREIRTPVFDGFISQNLNHALNTGDPRLIAAYAEFLVRRINLLDARLNNQSMEGLPVPGNELGILNQTYGSKEKISAGQMATLGDSYRYCLEWDTDIPWMQGQRAGLLAQLDSMRLENRPLDWLTAWAEQQGNLPPILLSEYWTDTDTPNLSISGAYTSEGHSAILGFIDELGRASRDQALWKDRRVKFLQQYRSDTQDAWYAFIKGSLLSAQTRLKTRSDWQQTLSVVGTAKDPFIRLLHRSAERFALIPLEHRAPWASRTVAMDRLLKLAANDDLHTESGALGNFKVTNALGGDVLKGMVNGGSIESGVNGLRDELTQARALARFQQLMAGVVADLQKNDAQAFQVALDTWGFGADPAVKAAPLWEADSIRKALIQALTGPDPREDVVWSLVTGQLDFSLHYVAEVAACRLQSDWSGQLLSPIEGVRDPVMLNELLYGERGQLPAFMNGPVKTFVQRDVQRYSGRESLGVQIPLTGAFYAYVSRMQHAQNDLVSAQRQSQTQQATDQQSKQALEAEQKTLAAQRAELKQSIATLQATAAVVELSASPSQVNISARSLPQQTRLTLQCSGRSTVLDNFNFPTSASFVWAPGACSDVSLEISFANFKLTRHWTGDRAFVDFLRLFNGGQHTFTPDDFPSQRNLMGSENLIGIQLTYRQEGEQVLLNKYAQADQLQMQLGVIDERLKAINEKLMAMEAQAAAMNVSLSALGSTAQQGVANIQPPTQIAWCWTPKPLDAGLFAPEQAAPGPKLQRR